MRSPRRLPTGRASCLFLLLFLPVAAGCSTDPGGHIYTAVNESDRDVIVEVTTDQPRTLRLPARTRGWLSESWSSPSGGTWHLTVRDASCEVLASFPLTTTYINLHVAFDGAIELGDQRSFTQGVADGGVPEADLGIANCE
jgi:hypothetical protein